MNSLVLSVAITLIAICASAEEIRPMKQLEIKPLGDIKLQLECLEELHGEVLCKLGEPCGPFYKSNSKECRAYRGHVATEQLRLFKSKVEIQPITFEKMDSKLFARCFEELRGEILCKVGSPCGPFYKDRTKECVDFRNNIGSISKKAIDQKRSAPREEGSR